MATRIVDLGSVVGPPGASGAKGEDGKSAYQYAVDGGYTGTEEQFKAKTAKEYLPLNGGDMAGNIDMGNHFLTGLPAPVAPSDAVNFQTLMNAIAGIETFALVIVTGTDYTGNQKTKKTAISIKTIGTAGSDTILYLSGEVTGLSSADIKNVTGVKVQLPTQFKYPSSDWSYLHGYDLLRCVNLGNTLLYMNYTTPVTCTINSTNFSMSATSVVIQGYVKVGVNV